MSELNNVRPPVSFNIGVAEIRTRQKTPSATTILRKAADLIDERAHERDRPGGERSMEATVAAFNAIYDADLSETQGWVFMAFLKIARSAGGAYKADDYEDLTAYAALAAESAAIENT